MVTKFEVKNFKNFDDWFCFDLSNTKNYSFRPECVKNGVVSKALIYGPNGSGKSNLGFAMLDLTRHLSADRISNDNYEHYFPIGSQLQLAEFRYHFEFDGDTVVYAYGKSDRDTLVYETLSIQGKQVLHVDRRESTVAKIDLKGAETLKTDVGDSSISLVTYVKNNSLLDITKQNELFHAFIKQASGMLFFRSLKDYRSMGAKLRHRTVSEFLSSENKVTHLEKFLNKAGIECALELMETDAEPVLMFVKNAKKAPFAEIASTGTHSLVVLYFWWQQLEANPDISFVYIDEFDAFYHHGLSRLVIHQLCELNAQVILTTHNTSIMSNDILRPDCYFLMDNQQIHSLSDRTDKELRSAHNIEKMYRAGAFSG